MSQIGSPNTSSSPDPAAAGGGTLPGALLNMLLGRRTDGGPAKPMLPNAGTIVPSASTGQMVEDATNLANGGKMMVDGSVQPPSPKTENTKPQVGSDDIMTAITSMQKDITSLKDGQSSSGQTAAQKGMQKLLSLMGVGDQGSTADASQTAAKSAAGNSSGGANALKLIMSLFT